MRDRSERKQAQEALEEREQRLQAILDNTSISVYIKDTEGRYLFVSRGFERAYGRSGSEILGRTDYDLSSPEFAAHFRAHDLRILGLSQPIVVEEDVKTHDGVPLTYLSSKFPLLDASGRAYAVCGISTDITHRKQAEQEISRLYAQEQAARAEAEAANRAKDEFLAILSHELRTPLTTTSGWLSLLRSKRLDADATAQGLEAIERSTRVQARLVEDLIDASKIISGKLPITLAEVDLAHWCSKSPIPWVR
jgi:PAS domain S-box-containing protein